MLGEQSPAVDRFLAAVEAECKLRDSRILKLLEMPGGEGRGSVHIKVGVKFNDHPEAKISFVVSPEQVRRMDVPTTVSGILMTVDRYGWGFGG